MKIGPITITRDDIEGIIDFIAGVVRRNRVPKARRNRVGILIAIDTEEDREKRLVASELVSALECDLEHSNLSSLFSIVLLNEKFLRRVQSPEMAEKFRHRARCHMIIYGRLAQRTVSGKTNYVFNLRGRVVHGPIPPAIQQSLSKEFGEVLPARVTFPTTDELLGFDLTRELVQYGSQYILGIAAALSGDVQLAYRLYTSLEKLIRDRSTDKQNPILNVLEQRLNTRIVEVLRVVSNARYQRFRSTRDKSDILLGASEVREWMQRSPDDYNGKLTLAMLQFFEGGVDDAIRTLESIRSKEATWRYSLGFLYAYVGRIDDALEQYRRAYYGEISGEIIVELESFLTDLIEQNPEKSQLRFFRGLLNLKVKPDYDLAREDLLAFLDSDCATQFPLLQKRALNYLGEIDDSHG